MKNIRTKGNKFSGIKVKETIPTFPVTVTYTEPTASPMPKRGRPKKEVLEQDIPMLAKDLLFESQQTSINPKQFNRHLELKARDRLMTGYKDLHEYATGERLPDTRAKAMAERWLGKL